MIKMYRRLPWRTALIGMIHGLLAIAILNVLRLIAVVLRTNATSDQLTYELFQKMTILYRLQDMHVVGIVCMLFFIAWLVSTYAKKYSKHLALLIWLIAIIGGTRQIAYPNAQSMRANVQAYNEAVKAYHTYGLVQQSTYIVQDSNDQTITVEDEEKKVEVFSRPSNLKDIALRKGTVLKCTTTYNSSLYLPNTDKTVILELVPHNASVDHYKSNLWEVVR